jgi:hypothetical protein
MTGPRLCPKHRIPLVNMARLSKRHCRRCKKHRLGALNRSGICIDCQLEMQGLPPRRKPKPKLVCPACAGEVISEARAQASRANGRKGGTELTRRVCRRCHRHRLAASNRTGICRKCQRKHGLPRGNAMKDDLRKPTTNKLKKPPAEPEKKLDDKLKTGKLQK